ncbi:unnamed protein product [Auanema sp. JU1783]|nr:unnamed protein product [Auanema sp. JU1783]
MAFFNPKSAPVPIAPPPNGELSYGSAGDSDPGGYPMGFLLENTMDVLTFLTNLFVLVVLYVEKKEYRCSFYLIMTIYMGLTLLVSFSSLAYCLASSFSVSIRKSEEIAKASCIIDYFTSFYAVALIFLMACERCFILVYPHLFAMVFRGKVLVATLCGSGIITLVLTFLVSDASETSRMYDPVTGMVYDYAKDPDFVATINNVFYIIPLLTTVFFARIYYYLQQIKKDAILGKTKNMVDKAEVSNCRQALCVVGTYSICLILHFVLDYVEPGQLEQFLTMAERLVASLPQVFLPLSLILCSSKIRRSIKICMCCHKEPTRVGSATSTSNSRKFLASFRLSLPNLSTKT